MYNIYAVASLLHYSSAGNVILHGVFLQGTVITQMINGASSLHYAVFQIYCAKCISSVVDIGQNLINLLQKIHGFRFLDTMSNAFQIL